MASVRSTRGCWDWDSKKRRLVEEKLERKKLFQAEGISAPKAREAGHPQTAG